MDASQITGANPPHEQRFRLDALEIDPRAGLVSGPGGREKLDPKVMAALVLLARLWPHRVDARYRAMIETLPKRGDRLNGAIVSLMPPPVADASKPGDSRSFRIAVGIGAATALFFVIVGLGVG